MHRIRSIRKACRSISDKVQSFESSSARQEPRPPGKAVFPPTKRYAPSSSFDDREPMSSRRTMDGSIRNTTSLSCEMCSFMGQPNRSQRQSTLSEPHPGRLESRSGRLGSKSTRLSSKPYYFERQKGSLQLQSSRFELERIFL